MPRPRRRAKERGPSHRGDAALVLAAFEPFAGRSVNRSLQVARIVARETGHSVRVLPVRFDRIARSIHSLLRHKPGVLLLLGEHHRATRFHVERVAHNRIDARIPDNAGRSPRRAVRRGGPPSLRSTLPLRRVLSTLARHAPARLSADAGRFACNAALYQALDACARGKLPTRAGFVHVPLRGVPLSKAAAAVTALVRNLTSDALTRRRRIR